jgi:hypothetical protein
MALSALILLVDVKIRILLGRSARGAEDGGFLLEFCAQSDVGADQVETPIIAMLDGCN